MEKINVLHLSRVLLCKEFYFCVLNKNKVIVIKWNNIFYYFALSNIVTSTLLKDNLYAFIKNNFLFEKRAFLVIRGLGLKITIYRKNRWIRLKLGNSHSNLVYYPADVFVSARKTLLFFKSFNKLVLGNLISTIKKLKKFSNYKDKGIFHKNEKKKLKIIKKK